MKFYDYDYNHSNLKMLENDIKEDEEYFIKGSFLKELIKYRGLGEEKSHRYNTNEMNDIEMELEKILLDHSKN